MSANIFTGGLIGAAPTNFYGIWGIDLPGPTYRQFYDPGEYKTEALSDSPVGLWMLDDLSGSTADDAAGSYDLTYANSPNLNALGASFNIPYSVEFNGSDENAAGANSATFTNSSSGTWSLECWLAYTSTSTSLTPLMVRNTDGTSAGVTGAIIVNNTTAGVISAQTFNAAGSGFIQLNSASGFNDGKWHHVVATATSGGAFRLYVDGTDVANSTAARNTTSSQRSITVASNRTGVASYIQFFPGYIAGCAYYSTALSATVVTDHYNAGKP